MRVLANGSEVELQDGATIVDLVRVMGMDGQRFLVVEHNGEPVPMTERSGRALADGDRVELVRAVAGG